MCRRQTSDDSVEVNAFDDISTKHLVKVRDIISFEKSMNAECLLSQ